MKSGNDNTKRTHHAKQGGAGEHAYREGSTDISQFGGIYTKFSDLVRYATFYHLSILSIQFIFFYLL